MLTDSEKEELRTYRKKLVSHWLTGSVCLCFLIFGGGGLYAMHQHNKVDAELSEAKTTLNQKSDTLTRITRDLEELKNLKNNMFNEVAPKTAQDKPETEREGV